MNRLRVTAMLTVVGFGMLSVAAADDKVALKAKYPPGTYVTTIKTDSTAAMTMDGKEMPATKTSMTMVMEFENGKADAKGQQEVTIKYTKIKQTIKAGGKEMAYDSEGDAEKQDENLAKVFKPLLGAKITVIVDSKGAVVSVKGLDEMFDKMGKENEALAPMVAEFKKSLGDQTIKQMFEMGQKMLPEKPVGVGDAYENTMEFTFPLIGPTQLVIQGKVKSIDKTDAGTVATLDIAGKTAAKDPSATKPATTQMSGMDVTIGKMVLDQKGQQKFNIDKGIATESNIDQTMDMEMTMKIGEEEKTLKMKQETKVSTTTAAK